MTPGIASLNPGLMSEQPSRAAGLHAGGVKEISPRRAKRSEPPGVGESLEKRTPEACEEKLCVQRFDQIAMRICSSCLGSALSERGPVGMPLSCRRYATMSAYCLRESLPGLSSGMVVRR